MKIAWSRESVSLGHPARSRLSCQLEFTENLDGLALAIAPDE